VPEGDSGFQLLAEEETAAVISIFFHLFSLAQPSRILLNFPFVCFRIFFGLFGPSFDSLIRIIG
jgi:hypothetical protein